MTGSGRLVVVGVSDLKVSADAGATLATYALGSCVGVAAYDPQSRVGGLLHFMLPDSGLNPERARVRPATFCDTGLQLLLQELQALGAHPRRLRLHLAGAARVLAGGDLYDVGRRNLLAARRLSWPRCLLVPDEDAGGELSRTLKLNLVDGQVSVRDPYGERTLKTDR